MQPASRGRKHEQRQAQNLWSPLRKVSAGTSSVGKTLHSYRRSVLKRDLTEQVQAECVHCVLRVLIYTMAKYSYSTDALSNELYCGDKFTLSATVKYIYRCVSVILGCVSLILLR